MASTNKLAFLAIAVLLLHASLCAMAQERTIAAMVLTSIVEPETAACDGKSHSGGDLFVALTTGWFKDGKLRHRRINIMNSPSDGKSVVAEVVDHCDTKRGCKDDMIATSKAVWDALGLDSDKGEVLVTLLLVG